MHGKVSTEEVSENLPQPSESENASTTPTANGSGSTNTAGEKKEKSKRDQVREMHVGLCLLNDVTYARFLPTLPHL